MSCVWHCFWQSAPFLLQRGRHMMLTWLELQWAAVAGDRSWLAPAPGGGGWKLQRTQGWARSLQPGRAVIRHQRHTSILAIVLRHHRHISSSEEKMMRKELMYICASVWVSWDWVVIVYVSSQSLWSSRVHILVSCYWLSDVTARLAAAELTNSVSRCYTAAQLTVGWLTWCPGLSCEENWWIHKPFLVSESSNSSRTESTMSTMNPE